MKNDIKLFFIALLFPLSLPILGFFHIKGMEVKINRDKIALNKCLYELQALRKVNTPIVTECNEYLCTVSYKEESIIEKKINSCSLYENNLRYNEERLETFLLYFAR